MEQTHLRLILNTNTKEPLKEIKPSSYDLDEDGYWSLGIRGSSIARACVLNSGVFNFYLNERSGMFELIDEEITLELTYDSDIDLFTYRCKREFDETIITFRFLDRWSARIHITAVESNMDMKLNLNQVLTAFFSIFESRMNMHKWGNRNNG